MHTIKAGSLVIYDSRDKNRYPVSKSALGEELNTAGTLSFTIYPGHPNYDNLRKCRHL